MDLRDTLSALLPAPSDDEPLTLRQDIIDELTDHLACAFNRELLRGADSKTAHQRVLNRFGDPAAVARRLWLDAMKGKIMAQRVLITSCLVLTLACLSLVGLLSVQSSRAAAQAAEANRKLTEALAQAQSTNGAMLVKLSEMSEAIRNPRSLDWNPVKITVTDDTPEGVPVDRCTISIHQSDSPQKQIERTSDRSGVADFGLVNPGEYAFQISKSQDKLMLVGQGQLRVDPGSQINHRILRPVKALEPVPVRVRCAWPADLEKKGLVLASGFRFMPVSKDGIWWSLESGWAAPGRSVLFGPGPRIAEIGGSGLYAWASSADAPHADILTSYLRPMTGKAESPRWERGKYQLVDLIVMRPRATSSDASGRLGFDVLVRCYPSWQTQLGSYYLLQKPPSDEELRSSSGAMLTQMSIPGLVLSQETWSKFSKILDASPERENEWTVTLPDELADAVRAALNSGAATSTSGS